MISGVSFQPGVANGASPYRDAKQAEGVQEAIRVLSLRLPKVVGAQGVAPQALLSSPGAGGDPRVDSIVNRVWSNLFPTGPQESAPQTTASFGTTSAPSQDGSQQAAYSGPAFGDYTQPSFRPRQEPTPYASPWSTPRVIANGGPIGVGDFTIYDGGVPSSDGGGWSGNPPGVYETLPKPFDPGGDRNQGSNPFGNFGSLLGGSQSTPENTSSPAMEWPGFNSPI
jgi:hypothetical protein